MSEAGAAGALLTRAGAAIREADLARRHGYVSNPDRADHRGDRPGGRGGGGVRVGTERPARLVLAQAVGFRAGRTLLMPLGELGGIAAGQRRRRTRTSVADRD